MTTTEVQPTAEQVATLDPDHEFERAYAAGVTYTHRRLHILTVACPRPRCAAPAGVHCTTPNGWLANFHRERVDLAYGRREQWWKNHPHPTQIGPLEAHEAEVARRGQAAVSSWHIAEARRLLSAAADRLQVAWDHPDVAMSQKDVAWEGRRLIKQTRDLLAPATVRR